MGVLGPTRVALAFLAVLVGAASPSFAADDQRPGESSDVSMHIDAGLAGYVDPNAAVQVSVELAAAHLTVGRLELELGGTVSTEIEVPAGGVKHYQLGGPAPLNRRQLTVRLVDTDGNELASETVRLQVPGEKVLVGVLDVDGVDTALRSATSTPLQREVMTVPVGDDEIGPRLAPLDYLVVGDGASRGLDEDARRALAEWVATGGRLYGPSSDVSVVAEPAAGQVVIGTDLIVTSVGLGEIGVLESPSGQSPDEWGRIIRDQPRSAGIVDQSRSGAALALISAASAGQEASVPALPWLLAGIIVFILLVGPVNFLVLRSLGRPEWAWVTVPLLSVAFLGAFWGIGRSQLVAFSASHAAVLYDDGDGVEGSAGFLLQVGAEGEHIMALPDGWQPTPPTGNVAGSTNGTIIDGGVVFELAALGLGATEARWNEEAIPLEATLSLDEDGLSVAVINRSEWTLWAWGVVVNGIGFNGGEQLGPGADGTVDVGETVGRLGYDPVVAEAVGRRPSDVVGVGRTYEVVYPLASHLEQGVPGIRSRGAYVFGITSDPVFPMTLDGRSTDSSGTTLLVRRIAIDDAALLARGGVRPELLSVEGASSVERYGDEVYAYGADAIHLHYTIPVGVPAMGEIAPPRSGQFDRVEVYDWTIGEYRPFAWGIPFDIADVRSPSGEVVLRASVDDDRFFDQAIALGRYAIAWSDA